MKRLRVGLHIVIVFALLGLSACGGDKTPDPTPNTWDNAKWNEAIWQ